MFVFLQFYMTNADVVPYFKSSTIPFPLSFPSDYQCCRLQCNNGVPTMFGEKHTHTHGRTKIKITKSGTFYRIVMFATSVLTSSDLCRPDVQLSKWNIVL